MKDYEFLSYETFPEDQYTSAVVEVLIAGMVLPYQRLIMKDGSKFWSFPGCSATKNGVKKRFNGKIDSTSGKIKFEQALQEYIDKCEGKVSGSIAQGIQSALRAPASSGAAADEQLPF